MDSTPAKSGYDLVAKILETHPYDAIETMLKFSGGAEADWLEFKAGMKLLPEAEKKHETLDDLYWDYLLSIIAMANTRGGAFVIGVHDKTHEAVQLESCDPGHVIEKRGKEAYLREVVVNNLDRPDRKWTTKDHTVWSIPRSVIPFLDKRIVPYQGTDVIVFLVPPREIGDESFVISKSNLGSYKNLPVRDMGEIGHVKRLTQDEEYADHRASREKLLLTSQLGAWWAELQTELQDLLPTGVMYGRAPHDQSFVGRNEEIKDVQTALSEHKIVVVHGGQGKGKTTLVEHVANDWLKDVCGHAFWIDAERFHDWKSVIEKLVSLDDRICDWLDEKRSKQSEKSREPKTENPPDARVFSRWLLDKCRKGCQILFLLDNVEEPGLFSEDQFKDWFGEGLPNQFKILATSRIGMARPQGFNPVHQIELGYFDTSDAKTFLGITARGSDWDENSLSEDERKAFDDLVALTRGHAWTIRVIGKFIQSQHNRDDYKSEPMSFRSALEKYRELGLSVFSPEAPQSFKKSLWPTLAQIQRLPNGDSLLNLARFAALVAYDGRVENYLLRAFMKQNDRVTDAAFERAVKILARYSLFDSISEAAVEMHRNTQTVLQEEIDGVFLARSGSFLSGYPGLELRRWPDLLKNGVPTSYCPVRLMDFRTLQSVLPLDWSLLTPDMAPLFSAPEICWFIENGPKEFLDYPWQWNRLESVRPSSSPPPEPRVPGAPFYGPSASASGLSPSPALKDISFCRVRNLPSYWRDVLTKRPYLVRHCRLSELSYDDLSSVLAKHPNLVDELSFFRDNPRGVPHYLIAHPDRLSSRLLSLLDPEGWLFLVEKAPNLYNLIPVQIRSLFRRIEKESEDKDEDGREDFSWEEERKWEDKVFNSQTYDVEILSKEEFLSSDDGRAMAVYLMTEPGDASLRLLDPMDPNDWAILFAEKPAFIDEFGSEKLVGATHEGWAEALSRNPDLMQSCQSEFDLAGGIQMFTGDELVSIIRRKPALLKQCHSDWFSGANWAELVQQFPSLTKVCPWKRLSAKDCSTLLVDHPEWAQLYGLSFDGLDDVQWSTLLSRHPEYRNKCHCRFSERSASGLVSVIRKNPAILDLLSPQGGPPFFDPQLLFVRRDRILPWISLVASVEKAGDQVDYYREWMNRSLPVKWDSLDSSDWKRLLRKHPEAAERFPSLRSKYSFSGDIWEVVLSDKPWLYEFCDWSALTTDNWIRLLGASNGSQTGGQRQLALFLPEEISTSNLLSICSSLPWVEQAFPTDHPAKIRLISERNRFEDNLRSGKTVIPLKPEEFIWPHSTLARFCGDIERFQPYEQLRMLAGEIDRVFFPLNAASTLHSLSSLIFDSQDILELDVCRLERRILVASIHREYWDLATTILNRLPEVVEKAKTPPVYEMTSDLSRADNDAFAFFCRGEILWARGDYKGAENAFEQSLASSEVFEHLFSKPESKKKSAKTEFWDRPGLCAPERDIGAPAVFDYKTKQALADCKNCIPRELGVYKWFSKLHRKDLDSPGFRFTSVRF